MKRKGNTYEGWESHAGGHYTRVYDDMLNSLPFTKLSHIAVRVYIILKKEYKGNFTGNEVICPYSTFKGNGLTRNDTILKAIRELEAFGFITVKSGGLHREPNRYTFSDKWKSIKTLEEIERIKASLKL